MPFSEEIKRIVDIKVERLETIPDAFANRMVAIQRAKFSSVVSLLDELEYSNGSIVINEANLLRIENITEQIREVLTEGEFETVVGELLEEFDTQAAINYKYFDEAFDGFEVPRIANEILAQKKREAVIDLLNSTDQYLTNPMRQSLSNAVSGGATRKDLMDVFGLLINGDADTVGRLERATRQIVSDTFALSDRAVTNTVAEQLGLNWYLYVGGLLNTTRPFCKARIGGYFRKEEVQSWGALGDWAGRMAGTNEKTIFVTAGGYNCQHSILPVSEAVVPNRFKTQQAAKSAFKTPDVKFGAGQRFDDYTKGIRQESLIVIDKLPKPYEIKSRGLKKGSYYQSSKKLSNGKAGTLVSTEGGGKSTFLHEYGHHIDNSISKNSYKGVHYQRSMDSDFIKAKALDVEHLKGKFKGENMFVELQSKWKGKADFDGASDVFDSMSRGVFYDKYRMPGHGSRYYNRKAKKYNYLNRENQQAEIFAQMFEGYSSGGHVWNNLVEHFPNQASVFEKMMKEFANE